MDGLLGGDGGPPTVGPVPLSEALKVRGACTPGCAVADTVVAVRVHPRVCSAPRVPTPGVQ